jgi:uncharacterized protein
MKYHTVIPIKRSDMRQWLLLLLLFTASFPSSAQDDCYPPKPDRLVVDMVGILSTEEQNALESKLRQLNQATSNQVVIVVLDKLCAGDAAMTAYEIGERWKVGQKEFDNGIVILVKPTGGAGERRSFIATGYGLEGIIPDATAKLIVDQEMIPAFKQGNYYAGLNNAVQIISELASKEYNAADYQKQSSPSPLIAIFPMILIFGVWFLLFYKRTRGYARSNNLGFWAALALMNAAGGSHRGYYNNFRSGGGGFGGGSSGGFGGFGGGSFGGGGAGGSW